MSPDLSSIEQSQRCVPKTTGEHPGEWHEAAVSFVEENTRRVMVSVRHLVTGHVSHVELSDVVFGVDAERWAAEQLRAQELMVESKELPQGEIGWAANLAGYNKADADRPKDRIGSPNKPLMRKVNGSCDSRPLQGIACQNFESLSPVALDRESNTSDPRRFTTGAPEQEPSLKTGITTPGQSADRPDDEKRKAVGTVQSDGAATGDFQRAVAATLNRLEGKNGKPKRRKF